ncbi:glycosyltransferase family 4 protein [Nitrolancea hollandica]|uniref:glycosyltransferase family 4 protein n=1 Tax=Nitrolancea hollandica TaxID=1206749 RepID=UPI000A061234|nr:glycosyltransferase family 4 protein [Nitrolancea hollandica]
MRIALLSPLFEPVPPQRYGGVERIVGVLCKELARRGNDVTLFASGDSLTPARLIPCAPRSLRLLPDVQDQLALHVVQLTRVSEMAGEFDVIHNHLGCPSYPFARHWPTPNVTTLHGRLDLPELGLVFSHYRDINMVSISNHQRKPVEHLGLSWAGTVYNGVDLDLFSFQPGGPYLVFLGRVSKVKGVHLAVEVARRVGMPLKIAVKVEADPRWCQEYVAPLLVDPLIEFIGEVDEREKNALLGGAAALLFPVQWPEPFGLVMIEAMACGTPVIALRQGAVPEVVADGRTGFICDSVAEMVLSVGRLGEIDRMECRRHVERYFSAQTMTDGYEAVYRRLAAVLGRSNASVHVQPPLNVQDTAGMGNSA